MIEAYLQGMSPDQKFTLTILFGIAVILLTGMLVQGLRDFTLVLFHGYPPKPPAPTPPVAPAPLKPIPKCEHSDNLQSLCLRGSSGCATRQECKSAVEDGEY